MRHLPFGPLICGLVLAEKPRLFKRLRDAKKPAQEVPVLVTRFDVEPNEVIDGFFSNRATWNWEGGI